MITTRVFRRSLLPTLPAIAALLGLLGLGGCTPGTVPEGGSSQAPEGAGSATTPPLDLTGYRMVDLTWPFDEETIYWPTSPSEFELEELAYGETDGGWFYAAHRFHAPEHGGTHLDAPLHFARDGDPADRVPLERLVAPAVVIDVDEAAAADPDYRLTADDVTTWESTHGPVPAGAIVLLHTGWGARWPDRKAYLGDDTPGDASNLHFPSYGAAAAELLVEQRGAVLLGVDTASIDYGQSSDFPVHRIAAAADVPGLENVAHLGELPATGAWVIALPMKIAGGSGGPVRIVGLVPH